MTDLQTTTGRLTPVAPFDFSRSLAFLGDFWPTNGEQTITEIKLVKAVRENGLPVAFALRSVGTVDQPNLEYTLYSREPLGEADKQAVLINRIRFFLSLDDDLKPFYALAEEDPRFAPVVHELYGYHQVKFLTPFENACWAILSQRNLLTVARKMKLNLMTHFTDNRLTVDGQDYWAFPDTEQLSTLSAGQIDDLIHNERKAECLTAVASAFSKVEESWLRTAPYAEAEKWLRSIKGIGEWSASFILLRGLGRTEWLPVGEEKLQRSAGQIYAGGHLLSLEDLRERAAPYGEWRGYWAHYLRVAA